MAKSYQFLFSAVIAVMFLLLPPTMRDASAQLGATCPPPCPSPYVCMGTCQNLPAGCITDADCPQNPPHACVNGQCVRAILCLPVRPCPLGQHWDCDRCAIDIGQCTPVPGGCGPGFMEVCPQPGGQATCIPNPPNLPEMSDYLALAFIIMTGGLVMYLRRRTHAKQKP